MGQVAQEQGYAYHGVAAGMDGRVDDAAVALTANQGAHLVHEGGHVDFTNGRCIIFSAVLLRHVPKGARGTEIGYRGDGLAFLLGYFAKIVRHGNQRILFHKRLTVLLDEGQTVHVRVHGDAQVCLFLLDGFAKVHQVGGQRLRVVRKVSGRVAVKADTLDAQAFQETRHDDAAHRVDGIYHHGEMRRLDGFHVHGGQGQDGIQVPVREIFFLDGAQLVYLGKVEVFFLCKIQHGLAFYGSEEFAFVVQELKGVPLARVVAGGEDDAAVCLGKQHGHFRGGGRGKTAFDYIDSAADEGAYNQLLYHITGHTGVFAHDNFITLAVGLRFALGEGSSIGRREFDNVNRGQSATRGAADGSANTGNGFDKSHVIVCLIIQSY